MEAKNGMLLWVLGGAGVLLMYSAYKNQNPQAILASHLTPAAPDAPARVSGPVEPLTASRPSVGPGAGGLNYLYDQAGNPVGVVPDPYQHSPKSYNIPKGAY